MEIGEKNGTCKARVILAGTDASLGHSVMKNAVFSRSEWSQYDDESEWSRIFHKTLNIMCERSRSYDESESKMLLCKVLLPAHWRTTKYGT